MERSLSNKVPEGLLLLFFALAAGVPALACAGDSRPESPSRDAIAAEIASLEGSNFETREAALTRLWNLARCFPKEMLEFLPASHSDPEVAHRVGEIRREIGIREDPVWKEGFAAAGDTPELRSAVKAFGESPSAETMAGLAGVAGRNIRHFWRAHASLLEHPDQKVRIAALRELARIGAFEAIPQIARVMDWDASLYARRVAGRALREMRCREAIPHFVGIMKVNLSFCEAACQAILEVRDPVAIPLLADLLSGSPEEIRKNVLKLLDQLEAADPTIVPALAACLDDPSGEIRSGAVRVLARIAGRDWAADPRPEERIRNAREWCAALGQAEGR